MALIRNAAARATVRQKRTREDMMKCGGAGGADAPVAEIVREEAGVEHTGGCPGQEDGYCSRCAIGEDQSAGSVCVYVVRQVAGWIRTQSKHNLPKGSRQPLSLARATVDLIVSFMRDWCTPLPDPPPPSQAHVHPDSSPSSPFSSMGANGDVVLMQVSFHYANMYVKRNGLVHMDAFDILLISSIIALKFWKEERTDINATAAETFNIPLPEIHRLEREFLKGIDYQLYLTAQEIEYLRATITAVTSPKITRSRRKSMCTVELPLAARKRIKC